MNLKNKSLLFIIILIFTKYNSQNSDFEKGLKIGEMLVNGLTILKGSKSNVDKSKVKSEFCVKNKLAEKIQFKLEGIVKKEDDETIVKKELVIPSNGKECLFELDKQIWNYEIFLTTKKEIHKKGELKVDEDVTITVNE